MRGKIKMVTGKGFGFITSEEKGDDIFFHASSLADVSFDEVQAGMEVSFNVVDGNRGLKAIDVEVIV